MFEDSDKFGTDVVLLRGLKAACQTLSVAFIGSVETLRRSCWCWRSLAKDSQVKDLLCDAPSYSEAWLFFSNDLLCLWLESVQSDLQHDFVWVADDADRSEVLALLQIAFVGKCNDKGLVPWGWPFSCPPDLVADCR